MLNYWIRLRDTNVHSIIIKTNIYNQTNNSTLQVVSCTRYRVNILLNSAQS